MPVLRLDIPDKSGGHYKVKRDKTNCCDLWKITVLSQFTYSVYDLYVFLNNKIMTMMAHLIKVTKSPNEIIPLGWYFCYPGLILPRILRPSYSKVD